MIRLKAETTAVLVVDIQERLSAAMPQVPLARMLKRTRALLEGAVALRLPVLSTEQYPKGLGTTVAALRPLVGAPVEKLTFTAATPEILSQLGTRKQVLLAGMETHICVFQTVRDLAEKGFSVVLCADAVLSRFDEDRRVGLALCEKAGATVSTVESVLFDLLGQAGTPAFKAVSAAIKEG